jgi:hypothetical protein
MADRKTVSTANELKREKERAIEHRRDFASKSRHFFALKLTTNKHEATRKLFRK